MPISRYLLRAAPLLLAVALYGYTVSLVLFLDDGPHFHMTEVFTGLDQWGGSYAYFYYRPAIFSLYKVARLLAGFYDPVGLHWLNVVLFGLAGVMVGMLARRIAHQQREWVGALAGMGFVLFPFSYQTVTLVGAMMHLVLILCVLLTLWCGLRWIDTGQQRWLAGALVAAFWGTFNQENGVLIVPVLGLLLLTIYRLTIFTRLRSRAALLLLPLTVITTIYLILRQIVPLASSVGGLQDLENITQSLATVLQAPVYPAAAVVRRFIIGTPAPPFMFLLAGVILLPLMLYHLWRRQSSEGYIALYGLVWFILAITPAVLMLDQHYVSGSPRILVFASVGISLFWAVTLVAVGRAGWPGKLIAGGVVGLALAVSLIFLIGRRDHFELQDAYMRRLNALMVNQPESAEQTPLLLVNAPDYLTPVDGQQMFLRGTEGAAMMFRATDYGRQIWVNSSIWPQDLQTIRYNQLLRTDGYSMYAHDPEVDLNGLLNVIQSGRHLYVTQFVGRSFYPVYVGQADQPGPDTVIARFGNDEITLSQLEIVYAPAIQGMQIRLRWRVNAPQPAQPFVHIFCDGELVGNVDAAPWGETYPFAFWTPGENQTDLREVRLSRPYRDESCYARLGVYRQSDGERLLATDAAGAPYENNLIPIPYQGNTETLFPFWGNEPAQLNPR